MKHVDASVVVKALVVVRDVVVAPRLTKPDVSFQNNNIIIINKSNQ